MIESVGIYELNLLSVFLFINQYRVIGPVYSLNINSGYNFDRSDKICLLVNVIVAGTIVSRAEFGFHRRTRAIVLTVTLAACHSLERLAVPFLVQV